MSKLPSNPEHPNRAHFVRVASRHAAARQGPRGSELVAMVTFIHGRTLLNPIALSYLQVHVLINDLIRLLYGASAQSDDDPPSGLPAPPSRPSPPNPKNKKVVRPSILPSMPRTQFGAIEARQLRSMIANVKSHAAFLKFIGADSVSPDGTALHTWCQNRRSDQKPETPEATPKTHEAAAPNRSTKRRRRKEK